MAIVTSPVVNMYANPNLFSETVSQAKMGDDVEILEDTGQSFFLVKNLWDGYTGYVEKKYVDPGLTDWNPDPEVVTASLANLVYTGAKVQSPLLTRLPLGIRLKLLNTQGAGIPDGWLRVEIPNDQTGFIQKGDTCTPEEFQFREISALRQSLVRWAKKFESAVPYLWGGTSSFGIDCSGFVQHIYKLHGLPLERDANQIGQGKYLIDIQREDVLPGDLIFFEGYGHVGLAISHYEFIHATTYSKPVVQVSEIDCPIWRDRIIQYSRYRLEK